MRLIYLILMILIGTAAGCALPPATMDRTTQMLDTQFNESANRIEQLLMELARAGGISTAVPRRSNPAVIEGPITVQWQGDALEVLRKLAMTKRLKFAVMGRPVPVPISIQAENADFVQVLENIGVQLGNRADVILKTDVLEIHYRGA